MRASIFVRWLAEAVRTVLEQGVRSPDAFVARRCQILVAGARGERASRIGEQLSYDDQTVLDVVPAFTATGLQAL